MHTKGITGITGTKVNEAITQLSTFRNLVLKEQPEVGDRKSWLGMEQLYNHYLLLHLRSLEMPEGVNTAEDFHRYSIILDKDFLPFYSHPSYFVSFSQRRGFDKLFQILINAHKAQ